MRPIRTTNANFTFLGTEPEIADLPGEVDRENGRFISTLRLTDEERAAIAAGGEIMLSIGSLQVPPVALWVEDVEEAFGDTYGRPDYRCEECGALYIELRAELLNGHCGQCDGKLTASQQPPVEGQA